MIQLVTASETAVFRSDTSSSVGFNCVQNAAAAILANPSFTGRLSKIIVISLGSPYVGTEYFERVTTYINTYSNDASTHQALLKVLTGELPFRGVSPVSLNPPLFNFNDR